MITNMDKKRLNDKSNSKLKEINNNKSNFFLIKLQKWEIRKKKTKKIIKILIFTKIENFKQNKQIFSINSKRKVSSRNGKKIKLISESMTENQLVGFKKIKLKKNIKFFFKNKNKDSRGILKNNK